MAPNTDAAPAVRPPPPNAWASRSARTLGPGAGSRAGGSPAGRSSASRSPAPRTAAAPPPPSSAPPGLSTPQAPKKPASPASAQASPRPLAPAPAPAPVSASASTSDYGLPPLQGKVVRLSLQDGETVQGLLWAFDADSGTVVLETGPTATTTTTEERLAGTPYSPVYATPAQRKANAAVPKSSFRLVRLSYLTGAAAVATEPASAPAPAPSSFDPAVVASTHALARKAAAVAHARSKATRLGRDVSWLGQAVFDALDKTLPVRWHATHIIVLDQVVVHGPQYDPSSTLVPGYTREQLQATADGRAVAHGVDAKGDQVVLPKGVSPTDAKAVANSFERVMKVLEGERARIFARRQPQATA